MHTVMIIYAEYNYYLKESNHFEVISPYVVGFVCELIQLQECCTLHVHVHTEGLGHTDSQVVVKYV